MFLFLTLLAPLVSFWLYYSVASSKVKEEFFNYVEGIAIAAASQVDPVAHAHMIAVTGEQGPEHEQILQQLARLHKRLPEVHYLTTLIVRDGEGFIVTDTASVIDIAKDGVKLIPSSYMERYVAAPEDYENYAAATAQKSYVFNEPYTDKFGTFVGACAPVDKVADAYPTMVCVDVDASDYNGYLETFRNRFISMSGISALLCALIMFSVYQHQVQVKRSFGLMQQQRDFYLRSANSDPLTGALNRRSFNLLYHVAEAQFKRKQTNFALIAIDVDHFKSVNDSYGHDCGDRVLIQLVNTLNHSVRVGDSLARIGGEEFAIICMPTELNDALLVAEKLRVLVENMTFDDAECNPVDLTLSIGVYYVNPEDTMETAMKAVDIALYHAKFLGRNQVVLYSPDLETQLA
ncbi:MAG: GGDEF domain-containing protein [Pseudomonadota bacterium]